MCLRRWAQPLGSARSALGRVRYPATVLTGLRWSSFGGASALATGTLQTNTCTPNCASGKFVRYPVAVRANSPRTCKGGLRVYDKVTLRFTGRAPSSAGSLKHWTLGCPY